MDERPLQDLLRRQDGVVSRRQVLACGDDDLIERRIRRREWARVHPGVYVDHTGPLVGPARLGSRPPLLAGCAEPRLSAAGSPPGHAARPEAGRGGRTDPRRDRRPASAGRTRGHQAAPRDGARRPGPAQPDSPRVTFEEAVLQVASDASDEASAVAVIADACQSRRTTPQRLMSVLRGRTRLPRRRFLMALLEDVATGAYSVLEHRYLRRVERPHGLPTARRQRRVRHGRTPAYRDVEYRGFGVVVELDGRLGHEQQADRWGRPGP